MALNSIFCADVPLRHYLLTHSLHFYSVTSDNAICLLNILVFSWCN